jgi:hypothetical protein
VEVQSVAVAGLQGLNEKVVQRNLLKQVFEGFVGWLGHVRLLVTSWMVMA